MLGIAGKGPSEVLGIAMGSWSKPEPEPKPEPKPGHEASHEAKPASNSNKIIKK